MRARDLQKAFFWDVVEDLTRRVTNTHSEGSISLCTTSISCNLYMGQTLHGTKQTSVLYYLGRVQRDTRST